MNLSQTVYPSYRNCNNFIAREFKWKKMETNHLYANRQIIDIIDAHLYIGVISLLYQTTNIAESFCRGGRMSHGNSAVPWRTALAVTIGPATPNIIVTITIDRFNNFRVSLATRTDEEGEIEMGIRCNRVCSMIENVDILYTIYYIYIHTHGQNSGLPLFSLNIKLRIYRCRDMLRIGEGK